LKKIRLEDVHRYSAVGDVNFLPNGKEFLFVHKTIDRENNKYLSNIWSGDLSTCKVTQLTRGDKDGSPVVDPEGKSLLFTSRREKDAKGTKGTELYLLKLGGGESRLVKTLKGGFSSISWVDEENILFTTKAAPGENPEKPVEEEPVEKRTYVIDKIPFVSNGSGFTENRISQLYRLNVATGKMKPLEAVKGDVQSVEISPDRKRAAIIVKEDAERRPRWNNLYILDLKGGSPERIGDDSISVYACVWASCDELFVLGTDLAKGFPTNPYFNFVDLESKEMKPLRRDLDLYFGNSLNSDVRGLSGKSLRVKNGKLYSIITSGPDSTIVSMDKTGEVEDVMLSDGSIDCFDINDSGDLVYTKMTPVQPLELFCSKATGTKKITNFNSWMKGYQLSAPESFKVQASDGVVVDGWIMKPVDFDEKGRYPAVVEIHGGPKTAYGNGYMHEFQALAASGYAVVYCNPRGSSGYGTDFADIRGHYGERDFDDIMEVLEFVVNEYDFIDEERLGVTGGSYGGFMTNWIVGHTDVFKAAVSQRSISSWISFFGTTDIGYYFAPDQIGDDFFQNLEGYLHQSPLTYAPNVETPILFIHSLEDYRCWVPEAMQFFTVLRYLGKEARMVLFPGENHELSRGGMPVHREKRLKAIVEWFDTHLKK